MFERIDERMLCRDYWVLATEKNEPVQISEIHTDGIVAHNRDIYLFDELAGIYITTDWLRAAGFLQQENGMYKKEGFPFHIIQHEYIVVLFNDQEIAGLWFVHELQHFYAGVKQRELLIKGPHQ